MAQPLSILAAGSLKAVLTEYAAALPVRPELLFGPAGLLRGLVERGHRCDVFLSANTAHPAALGGGAVAVFARNPIRVVARRGLGITADTLLDRLLDPALRLGTSTPGADPSGDYALQLFARAEALSPGAEAVLRAKALPVVGGAIPGPSPGPGGPGKEGGIAALFAAGTIDAFVCYRTSASQLAGVLDVIVPAPPLAVVASCALAVLRPGPEADAFAAGLLGPEGRALLGRHGFDPPG